MLNFIFFFIKINCPLIIKFSNVKQWIIEHSGVYGSLFQGAFFILKTGDLITSPAS